MQTKKEKIKGSGLIFFLVPFLFVPYIKLGGSSLFVGMFTFAIPALTVMLNRPWLFAAWSRTMLALVSVLFLIVLSYALNMVINDSVYRGIDLKGLKMGIANIFIFSSCLWLYYAKLRHWATERLVYIVYFAVLVNALLSLAIFLSLDLETLFYSVIGVNELYFEYPFRRPPGLMYDGFSYLSSLLGLTFVIGVILFFESRRFAGITGLCKFVCMQAILLVAIVINGRSGLVVCFTGLFVYFLVVRANNLLINRVSLLRLTVILGVTIGICAAAYFALINSEYGWYFDWAFGFVTDFISGGEIKDSSVVEIGENHMFLPEPIFDVVFGRNDFNADPTISTYHSDLGYVQMIHGFGGITVGFLVMLCVFLGASCIKVYRSQSMLGAIVIIFIAEFLLLNFKDFYFVSPYPHFIAFYLFMIALFDRAGKGLEGQVEYK
jgi:hypothetical protein